MNIRNATQADALAIAEVHVRSWQHTYRGIVPDAYLDSMSVAKREVFWRESLEKGVPQIVVAESKGKIVGFSSFGQCRDDNAVASDGEIWAIYLLPLHWGKGLGRALLLESRAQLLAKGMKRISLWVIAGNERALRFYRSAGFEPEEHSLKTFELAGAQIGEIRYVQDIRA